MNDVEVVLHCGAVRPAEAEGEEEEQHQRCWQPAARQDAEPHVSVSTGQHAADSLKALQGTQRDAAQLSVTHSSIWSFRKRKLEEGWN